MLADAFSGCGQSAAGPKGVEPQSKARAAVAVPPGGMGGDGRGPAESGRNGLF